MQIRDARAEEDAAACAAIYEPYVRDTVTSLEESPPSAQELKARIEAVTRSHAWLVAEEAQEIIAYAYGTRHRERACYRWAADVTVYVTPERQRAGVGRALYGALFERLARQGFRMACAGITLPNDASVGLHEALGFQPVGVYRKIGWKLGAWHDVGWWQLELPAPGSGGDDPPREPQGGA